MGAGVRIATDNRHTGQCCPLLGTNNMHDALPGVHETEILNVEGLHIGIERFHLQPRHRVLDACNALGPALSWHIVVNNG